MRKTAFIIMAMLASLGLLSACSSDEEEKSPSSCISGTIIIDYEVDPDHLLIKDLEMPIGDNKYSFIKIVVVPIDEFPVQDYKTGDIIDFTIDEIKAPIPLMPMPSPDPISTSYTDTYKYLCSIKLCK